MLNPTGRSGLRDLIAARAATWPALIPSAIASNSSGSSTFASRYRSTPAAADAAATVCRSSVRMMSGRSSQDSRRARFGSFIVTAMAIRAPIRSITTPQ
jgi:hypothetical protein